jgi:secreted trypsin-like serine protease
VRRLILVLATIGVAVLLASGAALGITGGTADTTEPPRYPYVGALLWPEGFGDDTYTYCTGTLISPTVFLTAAHCYPETGDAVTFDAKYDPKTSTSYSVCLPEDCTAAYDGTFYVDPKGTDIAVVEFREPIPGIDPTKLPNLPTAGKFNTDVGKGSRFTAVGYGAIKSGTQSGGPSSIAYEDVRRYAVSTLKTVNRDYLRLSQNQGSGGTCYGDSGGPNFVGEYPYNYDLNNVPIIASTTITGDGWCNSTNVTLRLDTASARGFLDDYVTLP